MNTIAPRLAISTFTAVRQLPAQHMPAHAALGSSADPAAAIILVLAILLVAALSSAAHGLATLLSELLRVAAAVTSFLFTVGLVTVLAVVILAHG
jgi:hypothetical protein